MDALHPGVGHAVDAGVGVGGAVAAVGADYDDDGGGDADAKERSLRWGRRGTCPDPSCHPQSFARVPMATVMEVSRASYCRYLPQLPKCGAAVAAAVPSR